MTVRQFPRIAERLLMDKLVLCSACSIALQSQQEKEQSVRDQSSFWRRNIPEQYRDARNDKVRAQLQSVLQWNPAGDFWGGVGITGPVNSGKTCAMALLLRELRQQFIWTRGDTARQIATDAVAADGADDKASGRRKWEVLIECPLLAIDDLDKATFTAAWAQRLFTLMESRKSGRRPTLWTANLGGESLKRKISNGCKDDETATAIMRRLSQNMLTITA